MNNINVISHRGANRRAPQNTIPAFRKSLEIGVDGFETDVHLTQDGVPVICHNYDIEATSNGKGPIRDKSFEELRKFDFGSYFSTVYVETKIPALDEFLALCKENPVKVMNIELKPPKDKSLEIVKITIDKVKEYGLFNSLIISSFSPAIIKECKNVDENTKTGFLYCQKNKDYVSRLMFDYVNVAKALRADYLHPQSYCVTKRYVEKLHENGIGVNPWTVDSDREIKRMIACGVDGIITDVPDRVNFILAE